MAVTAAGLFALAISMSSHQMIQGRAAAASSPGIEAPAQGAITMVVANRASNCSAAIRVQRNRDALIIRAERDAELSCVAGLFDIRDHRLPADCSPTSLDCAPGRSRRPVPQEADAADRG